MTMEVDGFVYSAPSLGNTRLTPEEQREIRSRMQRRLAVRWLETRSLRDVAIQNRMEVEECMRLIAWGLLGLGEVTLDGMIRMGFYKPDGKTTRRGMDDGGET